MKIISVVGARPQFIKLAPLSIKLRDHFEEIIIHTGQHYSDFMSATFFEELNIPEPDYNLGIGSGSHAEQTSAMMIGLEKILQKENPRLVIVFGDTNSTLAGAITACKLNIPVAHVESGLRSFNRSMPEEINRILTDCCSDLLFAPTKNAMQNLKNEGLKEKSFLTGDIMLDSLEMNKYKLKEELQLLSKFNVVPNEYYLLTLHRPYNVDDSENLENILKSLSSLSDIVLFPVHPRTKKIIDQYNISTGPNIKCIDPVGYLDFLTMQMHSKKIITDSGGIQKEAYLLRKPCITVRPETEWRETVETGWNTLVGFDSEKLIYAVNNFEPQSEQVPIFGAFSVAEKIVKIFRKFLK